MKAFIKPSTACGNITAPPSKSMAHRYLICAALASGESYIQNIEYSEDILATIDCLRVLGADIRECYSSNEKKALRIIGCGASLRNMDGEYRMNCRESGSTLRFMIPLCLSGARYRLYGSERLLQRPLSVYEDICRNQGILFEHETDCLSVCGKLLSGNFELSANISSQFISGLLFALPMLETDSTISFTTELESESYITLTLDTLEKFGVKVKKKEHCIYVPAKQKYNPASIITDGDYSNAAFFEALNYTGGDVKVNGLTPNSHQGDRVYKELFQIISKSSEPPTISIADCPDLAPILLVIAALNGGAVFTHTSRLRIKESDRGQVMQYELSKFGADITVQEDSIIVKKAPLHAPSAILSSHNDHRVAMSLAVLSSVTGGVIENAEAVRKSFPDFYSSCISLGLDIDLES